MPTAPLTPSSGEVKTPTGSSKSFFGGGSKDSGKGSSPSVSQQKLLLPRSACVATLEGHISEVACVRELTKGCGVLLSAGVDRTLRLWDTGASPGRWQYAMCKEAADIECVLPLPAPDSAADENDSASRGDGRDKVRVLVVGGGEETVKGMTSELLPIMEPNDKFVAVYE